jgi:hypothetical protein
MACRVLPGLARDGAFVMISADPSGDSATAYDHLMQVIRSDLRDPLRKALGAVDLARRSAPTPRSWTSPRRSNTPRTWPH